MATLLHETFSEGVNSEIHIQLKHLAKGSGPVAEFAGSIVQTGSARLRFNHGAFPQPGIGAATSDPRPIIRHAPDITYLHKEARYPGVIIEVSYGQNIKDLRRLAHNYLVESQGSVRFVAGLDLDYGGSKIATLSVWQPELTDSPLDGRKELWADRKTTNQVGFYRKVFIT